MIQGLCKRVFLSMLVLILVGCSSTEVQTSTNSQVNDTPLEVQLILAAKKGDISTVRSLIESGADINHMMEDNTYALYAFVSEGYKNNASSESLSFVKWLIEEKGAQYRRNGYNSYSLIHVSQDVKLTEYLTTLGLNINALTENNATTLMGSLASSVKGNEDISIQKYLVEHCVDLEQQATFGTQKLSAVDFAIKFQRTKAVELIQSSIKNPPKQCKGKGVLAPIISFYNTPETFDSEKVNISIKVEAQGFGVGDIGIFINGSEVSTKNHVDLKVRRGGQRVQTFNVNLQNGLNEIRVYAYDENNIVKSEEIVKNVVADYVFDGKPTLYALAIGIDKFEDPSLNLKFAVADAIQFGSTLKGRAKELFKDVKIIYLTKAHETTKYAILNELSQLRSISANDFFVFFSSTHGADIDGKYYMATSNLASRESSYIKRNSLSEDELRVAFRNIPTANKLLLFDTCYAGMINDKVSKALAQSAVGKLNLTSLTAAKSYQTAIEGFASGHGIFTYVLNQALDGKADINHDGVIQSMELVNYTNRWVPIEARKLHHVQTPAFFQSGQIFNVSKLRSYQGPINMKPQYFKPAKVNELISYMDQNNVDALNAALNDNRVNTDLKIEKIKAEAAKNEAFAAAETIKVADKKFKFGKHNFIFNDNSIFLDIKDKIKDHFGFTDDKGRHLIVFDFYSTEPAPRVVSTLDTEKVSDIYMADRGDWYRVTLQTKLKQGYEYIVTDEGVFIKLKNINK